MKIHELIKALETLDVDHEREILIYIRGPVGGLLDIGRVDADGDTITIDSKIMVAREAK